MQRSIVRSALGAAAVLILAGAVCTSSGRAQPALTPLNLGIIKIAGLTDAYAAQKLGYFAAEGLDVKTTLANNGQILLTGLLAGDFDIVLAIPGTAMQARNRGLMVKLVMQNEVAHAKAPDQGGVLVKADGPITNIKQLEGKKIAYAQISNQQWAGVRYVLEKAGVKPETVQDVEMPYPAMDAALQNGTVDAIAQLEPFLSAALNAKKARVLSWNYVESVPSQPDGAFWATDDWSAKNRPAIVKFQRAMHKAIAYLDVHPEVKKALIAEFTGLPEAMLANLIPDVWTDKVVRGDWEKTMQLMVGAGLIKSTLTFSELVPDYAINPGQ